MTEKTKILVFPDYSSTGVWKDGGTNTDPEFLGVSPGLQLALRYWHETWEWVLCEQYSQDLDLVAPRYSPQYLKRWQKDGRELCKLMSAENDKYYFHPSF